MSTAKGNHVMAKSIEQIQKVIMKPEWKQLVDSVLSDVDITQKTQESVIAVTNAIVTPLSLLIHAAGLSQEDVDHCQQIWKETMATLGAKCVEKESKAVQAERSEMTLRKLEELAQYDRKVREGLEDGSMTPITKEVIQKMKLENHQPQAGPTYALGGDEEEKPITIDSQSASAIDQEMVPQEEEETAPSEDDEVFTDKEDPEEEENGQGRSPAAKRAILFTSSESEQECNSKTDVKLGSKDDLNTAINEQSSELPEVQRLNQVSEHQRLGLQAKEILAKGVAKKGLVTKPTNAFRIRCRKINQNDSKVKPITFSLKLTYSGTSITASI